MRAFIFYFLQVLVCSGILYGYYHFFLRNKRFHQYNRFYLLLAAVISIVIPFLQIPVYFDSTETQPLLVKTLTVLSSEPYESETVLVSSHEEQSWFTLKNIISTLYILATIVLCIRFWLALAKVIRLVRVYPGEEIDNIRFIHTDDPATPFSFFRWLFWNNTIDLDSDNGQQIFRHELFHIRHKHSWDIIFLEVLTILFWINPFFHLFKKEIRAIHEFLADKHAVEENKEWDYAELLLMQVLGTTNTRLTNPFFQNQIKRRIAMLTTSKKPCYQYLRKIMVLPLAALIVGLFAFTYKNKFNNPAAWQGEPITIVVDAGHGGNDPGAGAPGNETNEATLNLEVAQAIKKLGKEYNINIVMTRNDGRFPGNAQDRDEALKKRIEMVKTVNPAAFISVHMNMTPVATQNTLSGFEAYISRKRDDASIKLASVVLHSLAAIYKTRDEARIREAEGIYVLDKNSVPAIVLQCGYINNPDDLAFITNKSNQEKVARQILEGVVQYSQSLAAATVDTFPGNNKKAIFVSHPDKITLEADTIFFHPTTKTEKPDLDKSLIIFNGTRYQPGYLNMKTVVADEVHMYAKSDKDAIRQYGREAANGLLVFKNAKIIDHESVYRFEYELKPTTNDTDKLFQKVEIEPAFQGGVTAWQKFLEKNLDKTIPAKKGAPSGRYTVFIQFIVDQEGNVSDLTPLTRHGYGMEAEAMRLLKKSPKWLPGIQNGKKVKAYKKQPFNFETSGTNNDHSAKAEFNKEVVVVGYSRPKAPLDEVVVEGKPIQNKKTESGVNDPKAEKEIVTGYPTRKYTGTKEVVVKGRPAHKVVFTNVETQPSFRGGDIAWRKYLERNANSMIPVDNGAPAGTYTVITRYIVNHDGSISDITALTNFGYGMEEEAIRLLKNSPSWIPAEQNGKKVNAYRKQPITFQVIEEKEVKADSKNPELP